MTRVFKSLKKTLKELFVIKPGGSGYTRINGKTQVPKGHLAVYFGEEEGNISRVLVPVIYFNHPLFGDLLREAEKVYGHDHCGGIHVPCRLSEFEDVQSRICAAGGSWRRWL
ncbi:auxin-responsive protein SAUR36-like [Bidens hawaiensis]|uniref:auxin-responsive protein SAUR36-like n=1 Tax=Bidens hawaiensis TaxID=980011 RepID=UPI0040497224